MRLLDEDSLMNGASQLVIPEGQFAAFMFRFAGTNDATDDDLASLDDFGEIKGKLGARPFMNLSVSDLGIMDELDFGFLEATSVTNSNFAFIVILPASRIGDGNVFDTGGNKKMTFTIDNSGVAASDINSGTVSVYGLDAQGTMTYLPNIFSHTLNASAGGNVGKEIEMENIGQIYVTVPTNLSDVEVKLDGFEPVDAPWAAIIAMSNADCRREAAYTSGARIQLNRSASMGENLSDFCKVRITAASGGAAAPHIIIVSYDYDPVAYQRSLSAVNALTTEKFKKKGEKNRTRPIMVAQAMQTAAAAKR